ncbi:hypothetical protein B0H11DRAFT_523685 [Mycena galericulata]|nr:hypothetical protein B0H11DRAFT_523685 [Mycena galericulata]
MRRPTPANPESLCVYSKFANYRTLEERDPARPRSSVRLRLRIHSYLFCLTTKPIVFAYSMICRVVLRISLRSRRRQPCQSRRLSSCCKNASGRRLRPTRKANFSTQDVFQLPIHMYLLDAPYLSTPPKPSHVHRGPILTRTQGARAFWIYGVHLPRAPPYSTLLPWIPHEHRPAPCPARGSLRARPPTPEPMRALPPLHQRHATPRLRPADARARIDG